MAAPALFVDPDVPLLHPVDGSKPRERLPKRCFLSLVGP
jgi:hypothetical protein